MVLDYEGWIFLDMLYIFLGAFVVWRNPISLNCDNSENWNLIFLTRTGFFFHPLNDSPPPFLWLLCLGLEERWKSDWGYSRVCPIVLLLSISLIWTKEVGQFVKIFINGSRLIQFHVCSSFSLLPLW